MTLRIVDTPAQLDRALTLLEGALAAWSGGREDTWRAFDEDGVLWAGASYTNRDDCYCYVERSPASARLGVALSDDGDALRLEIESNMPARARRRGAVALDGDDAPFLMFSRESLALSGVREPLARLPDVAGVKGAAVAQREYILVGPFRDGEGPEALIALAALAPAFDAQLERRARLAPADGAALYRAAVGNARRRRTGGRVLAEAAARAAGRGLRVGAAPRGLSLKDEQAQAHLAISATADARDLQHALGALALAGEGSRLLLLPAPRGAESLPEALKRALARLAAGAVTFELRDAEIVFRTAVRGGADGLDSAALFD